jgi:DNA repair protein RadC
VAGATPAEELALLQHLIADLPDAPAAAAQLLDRLGSLAAVVAARPEQIGRIAGAAAAERIASTRALRDYLAHPDLRERPLLDNSSSLADYLRITMSGLIVEEVWALYLDAKCFLIRFEILSRGTVSQASIFPREIIARALELGAKSIILAHNHPSGDLEPSDDDQTITRQIAKAASVFDISLLDHFIVSKSGWLSFRKQGLL